MNDITKLPPGTDLQEPSVPELARLLATFPAIAQRQDSVTDQLHDLRVIANRFGMYDAADALQQIFDTNRLSTIKYGCHCDLEPHMKPDGCVIDDGRLHDCVYAKPGMRKEQCKYWRIIGE